MCKQRRGKWALGTGSRGPQSLAELKQAQNDSSQDFPTVSGIRKMEEGGVVFASGELVRHVKNAGQTDGLSQSNAHGKVSGKCKFPRGSYSSTLFIRSMWIL